MKKNLLLLILLLLMSCGGINTSKNNLVLSDHVIFNAFEGIQTDTLIGQVVDVEIYAPFNIGIYENLFVVSHHANKTRYNFSVYNKDNMELIGRYVNRGRAFNELVGLSNLYEVTEKGDTLEMLINDAVAGKIKKFMIPKVSNDSCVISADLFLDTEFLKKYQSNTIDWDFDAKTVDFIWQNVENNLAVNYRKINFEDQIIVDKEIMKPELNRKEKTLGGKLTFSIHHNTKKDKSKFVFYSWMVDQVNIFDHATGKITTSTQLNEIPKCNVLDVTNHKDVKSAYPYKYVGVIYSNDNIFLIRYLDSNLFNQEKMTLHLYDWNGNGKAILVVDNARFTVDEENGILYGLNFQSGVIKKYDISKYLK